MIRRSMLWAGFFLATALSALPATAQRIPDYVSAAVNNPARPAANTALDTDRKPAETLAATGVKPGDTVLELLPGGGYYTRILSKVVGPTGHVYALIPQSAVARRPAAAAAIKAIAADPAFGNVSVVIAPDAAPAGPVPVDVVWTSDNYHDMHNPAGARDMVAYNRALLAALKPGGSYVVIDHAAAAGSGFTETGTLHRADPAAVKAEVTQSGFVFVAQSDALHRTDDDHTARSTYADDQFVFCFRKP